jgi:DNA-damage-inducible protein J
MRHHLAVESAANTHFRGDCGVAGVLWRLKEVIFITMYCYFTKIYVYSSKKEYIMETTMNTISARIDSKLKTQAENLFNELGMNMSTAITVFLKQSVRLRRIPFEIALDTPNAETLAAMAEANEIASGKRKAKSYKNAKAMIKDILDD